MSEIGLRHRHPITPWLGRTTRGSCRGHVPSGRMHICPRCGGSAAARSTAHPSRRMSLFTDLVDVAAARLGGTRAAGERRVLRARRRTFSSRRSRSGARASTPTAASGWTDGRRAAAASPDTTGVSSGSAFRRSCTAWSSIRASSRATIPSSARSRRARSTGTPDARERSRQETEERGRKFSRDPASEATPRIRFAITLRGRVTHLRFNIYPDGGVARLRVYGEPSRDPPLQPGATRRSRRARERRPRRRVQRHVLRAPAQPHPAGPLHPHGRWLGDQASSWSRARLDHRSAGGPRDDRADRGGHRPLQGQRPGELLARSLRRCRISSPERLPAAIVELDAPAPSHAARARCPAPLRRLGHRGDTRPARDLSRTAASRGSDSSGP